MKRVFAIVLAWALQAPCPVAAESLMAQELPLSFAGRNPRWNRTSGSGPGASVSYGGPPACAPTWPPLEEMVLRDASTYDQFIRDAMSASYLKFQDTLRQSPDRYAEFRSWTSDEFFAACNPFPAVDFRRWFVVGAWIHVGGRPVDMALEVRRQEPPGTVRCIVHLKPASGPLIEREMYVFRVVKWWLLPAAAARDRVVFEVVDERKS